MVATPGRTKEERLLRRFEWDKHISLSCRSGFKNTYEHLIRKGFNHSEAIDSSRKTMLTYFVKYRPLK